MTDKTEILVIVAFVILILLIALPNMCRKSYSRHHASQMASNDSMVSKESFTSSKPSYPKEHFTAVQEADKTDYISGTDPMASYEDVLRPRGSTRNYESLIFDNSTGTIMTGSQFAENSGLVTPPWIPPAWNPDEYGPSSKGVIDPGDYENDPRFLYNRCSLSCCSPQYPTPFQGDSDPFVCDKNGNSKYLASDYYCQNNTGGIGCLCLNESQVRGMETGYFDSYVDTQQPQ